jgi:hypothetical protein
MEKEDAFLDNFRLVLSRAVHENVETTSSSARYNAGMVRLVNMELYGGMHLCTKVWIGAILYFMIYMLCRSMPRRQIDCEMPLCNGRWSLCRL